MPATASLEVLIKATENVTKVAAEVRAALNSIQEETKKVGTVSIFASQGFQRLLKYGALAGTAILGFQSHCGAIATKQK